MATSGVAAYNPSTGLPAVADANEMSYVTTTLGANVTIGNSTVTVASNTGLAVDMYMQIGPQGTGAEIVQITNIFGTTITIFPVAGKAHTSGDAVAVKMQRQVIIGGDATLPANKWAIGTNGALLTAAANARSILTSASPTVATNVKAVAGTLIGLYNTGPALTVYPQLYDSATTTVSQAVCIFGDGTSATAIGAGQVILLNVPLYNGLTYVLSGALPSTANLILLMA